MMDTLKELGFPLPLAWYIIIGLPICWYGAYQCIIWEWSHKAPEKFTNGERLGAILFAVPYAVLGIFVGAPIAFTGYAIVQIPIINRWLCKPVFPKEKTIDELFAESEKILNEIQNMTDDIHIPVTRKILTTKEILQDARDKRKETINV